MSTAALAPTTITLQVPGDLATTSQVAMRMPFGGTITSCSLAVTTAPTGSTLISAITVGATNAATLTLPISGLSVAGAMNATAANHKFNAGDVVKFAVSQVGSTVAGSNATVAFVVTQG